MKIGEGADGWRLVGFVPSKKLSGNGAKSGVFRAAEGFCMALIGTWWLGFARRGSRVAGDAADEAGWGGSEG